MSTVNNFAPFQTLAWIQPGKPDDDLILQLKNAGYHLQYATDSKAWLADQHSISPCIFLLTIDSDDFDFSDAIASLNAASHLPNQLTSCFIGLFEPENLYKKEKFIESGGTACLCNPVSANELLAIINAQSSSLKNRFESQAQIHEASQMALLAMENSSDLGGIIAFIKKAIGAKHYEDLASALFNAIDVYCENCLIEISTHTGHVYFAAEKKVNNLNICTPDKDMQHYLLNQKKAGRIIKLDNILQINQSNLVILLDGVPTEDQLRMERISDTLVILSDVANRFAQSMQIEENLRKTEKQRQAFLNTLSHELRTPLNGVIGFSKALKSKITNLVPDGDGHQALSKIVDGAEQINAIISTLLEISNFDTSQPEAHEKIDIANLFIRLKSKFQPLADAKSLDFSMSTPKGLNIFSHSTKVHNILSHLIDNAIKFTEQGHIRIEASIDSKPGMGQHLIFKIADTGIGIAPEDHQRIFTEIGQLNTEHNRKHYGMGLGLYYSYLVSKQLGGELTLDSARGEGACFYLTLPVSGHIDRQPTTYPPASDNLNDPVLF